VARRRVDQHPCPARDVGKRLGFRGVAAVVHLEQPSVIREEPPAEALVAGGEAGHECLRCRARREEPRPGMLAGQDAFHIGDEPVAPCRHANDVDVLMDAAHDLERVRGEARVLACIGDRYLDAEGGE
jgi:hypothetical protein